MVPFPWHTFAHTHAITYFCEEHNYILHVCRTKTANLSIFPSAVLESLPSRRPWLLLDGVASRQTGRFPCVRRPSWIISEKPVSLRLLSLARGGGCDAYARGACLCPLVSAVDTSPWSRLEALEKAGGVPHDPCPTASCTLRSSTRTSRSWSATSEKYKIRHIEAEPTYIVACMCAGASLHLDRVNKIVLRELQIA